MQSINTQPEKSTGISLNDLLLIFTALLLFFQTSLQDIWAPFNYLDELVSLVFFMWFLRAIFIKKHVLKTDFIILIGMFFVTFIGFLGDEFSGGQSSRLYELVDFVSLFRFILLYLGMREWFELKKNKLHLYKVVNVLSAIISVYVFIVFFFSIINLFKDIGMSYDVRFGVRSFSFIFDAPGLIINQMTYSIILFSTVMMIKKSGYYFMNLVLSFFVITATFRFRGYILIVTAILLLFLVQLKKFRLSKSGLIGFAVLALIFSWKQIEYYFFSVSVTPRQRFVTGAVQLFRQYFPIGSGFATFGSSAAAQNYSLIYYKFGFDSLYGMSPNQQLFLNDNFFPMIFGQFGLLGALAFFIVLIEYVNDIMKRYSLKGNKITKFVASFWVTDALMSSLQSSYLSHYSLIALSFFGLICIYCGVQSEFSENGHCNGHCKIKENI